MAQKRRQALVDVPCVRVHVSSDRACTVQVVKLGANNGMQYPSWPSNRPRPPLLIQSRLRTRPAPRRNHERHFRRSADLRFADRAAGGRFPERQELEDAAGFESCGSLFVGCAGGDCDEFGWSLGLILESSKLLLLSLIVMLKLDVGREEWWSPGFIAGLIV